MNAHALSILSTDIRQFDGLYSLNDLHKASGGENKHKPNLFLNIDQTKALAAEIEQGSDSCLAVKAIHGGPDRGTYGCKEIVVAYGAWISPRVHLAVIRAFLDQQAPQPINPEPETLTPSECQLVRELVKKQAEETGIAYPAIYARIQNKFRVNTYKALPRNVLSDVVAYVTGIQPKALPAPAHEPEKVTLDRRRVKALIQLCERAAAEREPIYQQIDALHEQLIKLWSTINEMPLFYANLKRELDA